MCSDAGTSSSSGGAMLLQRKPCTASTDASTDAVQRSTMFAGKVIVITGAGKGIGEAAALMFAEHGASGLVLSDLDAAAAGAVAARARALGVARAEVVAGDVTRDAVIAEIVAAAARLGRLDVLVNNAGYTFDGVVHKITPPQWDAMLAVHATAPFKLIQAAAPLMRGAAKAELEASGAPAPRAIINISSTSGTHGNAGQANYAAAKAAVVGLTKAVAKEWGPLGVRANAIAFGLIDTRLTRPKVSVFGCVGVWGGCMGGLAAGAHKRRGWEKPCTRFAASTYHQLTDATVPPYPPLNTKQHTHNTTTGGRRDDLRRRPRREAGHPRRGLDARDGRGHDAAAPHRLGARRGGRGAVPGERVGGVCHGAGARGRRRHAHVMVLMMRDWTAWRSYSSEPHRVRASQSRWRVYLSLVGLGLWAVAAA